MKIGFFDSGLGGLTILNKALQNVKAEYIYLADNKNVPYGIKEKHVIKKHIFDNIDILVKHNCKIIVIACNTATAIAVNELREKYKDICIIGTEPAVKMAIDSTESNNKKILVCATTTTIKEEKLHNLITNLNASDKVELLSLDGLVKMAEDKDCNKSYIQEYLSKQFEGHNIRNYSHVVLGCTHFPLFSDEFKNIFKYDTKVIDGSEGVVKNLKRKVDELILKDNTYITDTRIKLLITKNDPIFIDNFKRISNLEDIEVVNI